MTKNMYIYIKFLYPVLQLQADREASKQTENDMQPSITQLVRFVELTHQKELSRHRNNIHSELAEYNERSNLYLF